MWLWLFRSRVAGIWRDAVKHPAVYCCIANDAGDSYQPTLSRAGKFVCQMERSTHMHRLLQCTTLQTSSESDRMNHADRPQDPIVAARRARPNPSEALRSTRLAIAAPALTPG